MYFPESWTRVRSAKEGQQADPDADSDSYSIIFSPTSSSASFELLSPSFAMAKASSDGPEMTAPNDTINVDANIDWTQDQPEPQQIYSNVTASHRANPSTPPSMDKDLNGSRKKSEPVGSENPRHLQPQNRVYTIDWLLQRNHSLTRPGIDILPKIKPEAIAGKYPS